MRKTLITLLAAVLCAVPLHAQFYLTGDDPGHLKWYSIETPHYELVYPSGSDSLARVYGTLLEQFRVPMGKSIGEIPGEGHRWKMPVVLHTHYPYSNGSMVCAPWRMDLYTMPEAYGSDPAPWAVQLAAHEPRHYAQLQLSAKGFMKPLPYVIGQAWNAIGWVLYFDSPLGEGDAVAAETGLAHGTRAYTADFLNYIQVALDQGDYRNWEHWYYGSYKKFTPDHYKISYMTVAGGRYMADNPFFTKDVISRSLRHPWPFSPSSVQNKIKADAGKKNFKDAYPLLMDTFNEVWQASARERGPFLELEPVSCPESFPVDYENPTWADGRLFAVRSGYLYPSELVEIVGGKAFRVHSIGGHTSQLSYDARRQRIYWSETRKDPRWSLSGSSVICFYDVRLDKVFTLTSGTRYYSPKVADDGTCMSVIEYRTDGSQCVLVLNPDNGAVSGEWAVPSGVQFTETAWLDGALYAVGVGDDGYGLWMHWEGDEWQQKLAPSAQKVVNFDSGEGALEWVSDRTGVNELYSYLPSQGRLLQQTATRYGATDFCRAGDELYCTSQTLDGKMLYRVKESALLEREVNYSDLAAHPIEEKLKEQEASLGAQPDPSYTTVFTAPKRYSKLGHTSLHSWLPLYVDGDAIMKDSFDLAYEYASLGLTGFFQNTLSTFSGVVGYGIHPDPDQKGVWRNAFHLRTTYSGLFPIFEFKLDVGDQLARQYFVTRFYGLSSTNMSVGSGLRTSPLVNGSLRVYIPWQFQRNGMLYGLTPQLRYSLSNNLFARGSVDAKVNPKRIDGIPTLSNITAVNEPNSVPMQHLSTSVRGYWMRPRPVRAIYPRYGIGLETGLSIRPGITEYFAPNVYAYAYGYLPGFWRTQGIRLTGTVQQRLQPKLFRFGEMAVNTLPRGFNGLAQTRVGRNFPNQWKLTADYAIPVYVGEIFVPRFLYIKNFLLSPHGDFTGLGGSNNLWSAGMDISASFNQILFFSFKITLGVSVDYMGGSWFAGTGQDSPWSVGLIFNWDI